MKQMTAELKKTIKQQQRLQTIEQAQAKANDLKIEEAQLLANMMFSVNAIARALTEKVYKFRVPVVNDEGYAEIVKHPETGEVLGIATEELSLPLLSMGELNISRMRVIQEYHEERRKEKEAEEAAAKKYKYNDEEHTAAEWAELLGISTEQMDEYLHMGAEMQDIVETLAEENLKPDEKQLIRDKVQEAVNRAKAARAEAQSGVDKTMGLPSEEGSNVVEMFPPKPKGGNGTPIDQSRETGLPPAGEMVELDLDSLTEDEMAAYLETGAVPERLHVGQPG
jgi:hypothetical protein